MRSCGMSMGSYPKFPNSKLWPTGSYRPGHFVTETKLRPTQEVSLPNFCSYRTDCLSDGRTPGGRVTIFARRSIRHLAPSSFHILQFLESLGPILLVAAYFPPRMLLPTDDLQTLFWTSCHSDGPLEFQKLFLKISSF